MVFLISTVSVLISLVQTRRHRKQLHDMVVSSSMVTVYRDGKGQLLAVNSDIVNVWADGIWGSGCMARAFCTCVCHVSVCALSMC